MAADEGPKPAPGEAYWRAALAIYARPGAQAALLDLQDRRGADVMALLWAIAAAEAGRRIEPADMAAFETATAGARGLAKTLRDRRRALKAADPAAYETAKSEELGAERAVAAAAPDPAKAGRRTDLSDALFRHNFGVAAHGLSPSLDAAARDAAVAALLGKRG